MILSMLQTFPPKNYSWRKGWQHGEIGHIHRAYIPSWGKHFSCISVVSLANSIFAIPKSWLWESKNSPLPRSTLFRLTCHYRVPLQKVSLGLKERGRGFQIKKLFYITRRKQGIKSKTLACLADSKVLVGPFHYALPPHHSYENLFCPEQGTRWGRNWPLEVS